MNLDYWSQGRELVSLRGYSHTQKTAVLAALSTWPLCSSEETGARG